jgi:Ca-activated chloride channel family protein
MDAAAVTALWARAHLRDLEDRYVAAAAAHPDLERRIVDTSLPFGVLCRFTAYVAVDSRVVAEGGPAHRVVQPVELPAGWQMPGQRPAMPLRLAAMTLSTAAVPAPPMPAPPIPAPAASPQLRADGPVGAPAPARPRRWGARGAALDRIGTPPVPPALTEARELVSEELVRLRADTRGLPGYERRELLADLASRLRAMVAHLRSRGVAEELTAPVRELVDAIEAGGDVDVLWDRALRVLAAFSGTAEPRPDRPPFWKRA